MLFFYFIDNYYFFFVVCYFIAELSQAVVDAGAVPLLVLCIQEPEISLKRITASALSDISKHSPEVVERGREGGREGGGREVKEGKVSNSIHYYSFTVSTDCSGRWLNPPSC